MAVRTRRNMWMLARELAEALAASPEVEAFRSTEARLLADEEAVALVREYEAAKRAVKLSAGRPPEEQKARIEEFLRIEERFQAHPAIAAHQEARVRLDRLLERLNAVITHPITGTVAPRSRGGCGGCGCG